MARPRKQGLNYFPHDVDAVNDEKIEVMRALYSNDGYAFYFISLERIYRSDDGQLDLNTESKKAALASKIGISLDRLINLMNTAFEVGLFDQETYDQMGFLTSNGIKKRIASVVSERARKRLNKGYSEENAGVTAVFSGENSGYAAERKENKNKTKEYTPPPPTGDDDFPSTEDWSGAGETPETDSSCPNHVTNIDGEENSTIVSTVGDGVTSMKKKRREYGTPKEVIEASEVPEEVKAELLEYVKARAASRSPMTGYAVKLAISQLQKLAGNDHQMAKEIIQKAIVKNWKDFYPLTTADKTSGRRGNPYERAE